ncbi:MAG: glycerophosphodiester phosphodiesterase family protein, partial [Acidobacteria bacterium]|nr:glycerophosphodiester phosphodiesterase family protein [Acidobacteriota bacterium]
QARENRPKRSVAHRGASAYAPEHTAAAYRLAMEQGADYVEQDLAVTKDGVLICLHDESLERTTDVATRFPDRATTDAQGRTRWLAADFTLAEIKTLDAGAWFDATFTGERILTFEESIDLIGTRAGMYPELKSPALYRSRNVDIVALFAEVVRRRGLEGTMPDGRPRLVVQSFDEQAVRDVARVLPKVTRTFLIGGGPNVERWLASPDTLKEMSTFANDLGPAKGLLEKTPAIVGWAHAAGMTVTPYTFRSAGTGRFPDVKAEMHHFLYVLGVDHVFTDNPDQFPRVPIPASTSRD